ncbi:MAG TPA: HAD family hydrolase [Candidatus Saccharimonadales bacterium]
MRKLLLFDIDGTILASPPTRRFLEAAKKLHDKNISYEKDHEGLTDHLIMLDILSSVGWSAEEIERAMPQIVRALEDATNESFVPEEYSLVPGIKTLLDRLSTKNVEMGLLTGNLKSVAKLKLSSFGLWGYFSIGAFGSDPHSKRSDLVGVAINRAGFEYKLKDVYIIGDTPRDIIAAKEAGVKSVGVSNGFRPLKELIDEGADIVLEDFKDIDLVLHSLGV